ncbi:MAG: alpha/beta hydrolase [Cypionkella sp.]
MSRLVLTAIRGCLLAAALSACSTRGAFTVAATPAPGASIQTVLVATDRNPTAPPLEYGGLRTSGLTYGQIAVSIPPTHQLGQIEWPSARGASKPSAAKDFLVEAATALPSAPAFQRAVRAQSGPGEAQQIVVFVHGYNYTFAESVYRLAQFSHDYELAGPQVLFAWSSAASPLAYLYDRDSVAFARDSLEVVLTNLARSQKGDILLVGHSMGSQLIVETLRQMSIDGNHALAGRLSGVALLSPDIDVELFRRLLERIKPLPQPFVLFVSNADRALKVSALLTGQPARLGSVSDLALLAALPITMIDLSAFSDSGQLNHMVAATSPGAIALIKKMVTTPPQITDRAPRLLDIVLGPRAP